MKITIPILFILILNIAAFGQDKLKTHDALVNQIFALPKIDCGVRIFKTIQKDVTSRVQCQLYDNSSLFNTYVSFSFKGKDLIKSVDNFILSFRFTNSNNEWSFLNNEGITIKDITIFANGEKFVLSKFTQHSRVSSISEPNTIIDKEFYFIADRETLSKLAKAKIVKFNLGNFEIRMSERRQIVFQRILDLASVE